MANEKKLNAKSETKQASERFNKEPQKYARNCQSLDEN